MSKQRWFIDQKKQHVTSWRASVHIAETPSPAEPFSPVVNEPVTLFLPGGIRMCCHPSQLTVVFRALKHADT
ncbi:hypothetical protein [Citrobacter meridianamericanus]|uniref:hypothetical protein n=1 Tax=Citrobacter meridianamericanus TaxID=2894201 RepID=UPI0039BE06E5